MNDIAGDEPYDWSYQGQAGLISCILTRWNETVYTRLATMPNPFRGIAADGIDADGDMGTLMGTEGTAFTLWVRYPYGPGQLVPKPAMVANLMQNGYTFFKTFLLGPDDLEPGVRPYQITCNFYAFRSYNASARTFTLYGHNMAGLPNPD